MGARRLWSRFYDTFLSLSGAPESIAKAFSVGMVIAFCPFFGLHTVMSAAASAVFRLNFPAVYLASWISNFITIPFFLWVEYETGRAILGWERVSMPVDWTWNAIRATGWALLGPLLIGWFLLGAVAALATFPAARWAIVRARKRSTPEPPGAAGTTSEAA